MDVRRTLTEDLGIKVMAVVVAAFIWFNASGQQQVVRLREIPLGVHNLSDTLVVTTPLPDRVEVRVTGTRRQILAMGFRRVQAVLDLDGLGPGRHRVTLSAASIELPPGFDRRNIAVIAPLMIDVNIERVVTRRIPAVLTTLGELPDDLVLVGDGLRLDPAWITVRGPESTVSRMRNVPTRPYDVSRIRESGSRELPLDFDPSLVACEPAVVTVTARVEKRARRAFSVPPTVLSEHAADLEAVVLPTTVSITLEGPESVLDTLSTASISVLLQPPRLVPGTWTLAPEIIVPPGTEPVAASVDSFTVRLVRPTDSDAPAP